ncbi:MAG: TPR end-of-group domain-containing protein [Gaiellaceae bacterium]
MTHIDRLESFPVEGQDGLVWRPIRRHFDIRAFGVNAYTAEEAGQRVVEEHREQDGHEELYIVVSGRATFVVEGQEHDAPAGTLVHCPPGTLRGAFAAEPRTTVVGIGAKPGEVFQPSGWEWTFVALSQLAQGNPDEARRVMREGVDLYPSAWQGYFNLACIEARIGNHDLALDAIERAAELDRDAVARWVRKDDDLAPLQDEPRFLAIAGQPDTRGEAS